MNYLGVNDIIFAPVILLFILLIARTIKKRNITQFPEYKYFTWGLQAKLFGAFAFCMIYTMYYAGGDTISYFTGANALVNLLFENPGKAYSIIINNDLTPENYSAFNIDTGYPPWYMWKDSNTFSVVRYTVPLCLLGGKSIIATSFLTACVSYLGIWKLYRLFNTLYKSIDFQLAITILFIPTLIFWGSGIMKDSYVLGATCWFTYNFYKVFIDRKKILPNIILLMINLFLIISIKPYIILSLLPGSMLWLNSAYLKQLSSGVLRIMLLPFIFLIIGGGGLLAYNNLGEMMGDYGDIDKAMEQAKVIQEDLLREDQYGSNNYNLGELDGSLGSAISLAPMAIFTALYRPLFFEVGSPLMVISVIENTFLLVFTLFLLLRTNPLTMFRKLFSEPLILYAFIFSIILAFGVGIASTNFGAMVRYKTPIVPFFFTATYLLYHLNKKRITSSTSRTTSETSTNTKF